MAETNNGLIFHRIPESPFQIFGLYKPEGGDFRRIPEEVARATSNGVYGLHTNTAGGRVRFKTNSARIAVTLSAKCFIGTNMSPMLRHGCDVYVEGENGGQRYAASLSYGDAHAETYTSDIKGIGSGMKTVTVNMPLYGDVKELSIGLDENAVIEAPRPYAHTDRIVYYGSSITQGGCASRPGLCYQNHISRTLDTDYLNLGFSGNAKGEDAIVNYMASLDMCAFVCDYDHNAPTPQHLENTHYNIYEKVRANHPDIPFVMISRPNFYFESECILRRAIIMESYLKAYRSGDKNVYFIDGAAFFSQTDRDSCTVDRCHPNDLGFLYMGNAIGEVLKGALGY